MKVELTDLSPVKKSMTVEVDAAEVERQLDGVLQGYRKKANLPGFRQGKAPMSLIRSRFEGDAREETRERIVGRTFREALRERGLVPIGEPTVESLTNEAGQPLSYTTTFEVLPEVTVDGVESIEVIRPAIEVDDEAVGRALEELREMRAQHVADPERVAEAGDVAMLDVKGEPEGGEPFERESMPIEVGSERNLPQFNEHVTGAKAGATARFDVEYPADYGADELAGKTVRYELTVKEVKRRELPELDDEFARDLGEFDDLASLRARVRQDLETRKRAEADGEVRRSLLDKLLVANPLVLPERLVEAEVQTRLEEIVRSMYQQGVDPEKQEIDWKEVRDRQVEPARKAVHARLMLDAVAREQSLAVAREEIETTIRAEAARAGRPYEELAKRLDEGHGAQALETQLLREKSLDYLMSVANIRSED